jgi:acyl-CoA reductase-like NAD-dependent aldehyde dehydrogenase
MSTERIIVHQSVLSQFTKLLKDATNEVHGPEGTPHTVAQAGTVVRNRQLVKDAVCSGATIVYGGHDEHSDNIQPLKLPVTVVQGVSPGMDLFQTESFGPTVSLIACESDEHAIAIANNTEYGLTAAVFTRNIAKGLSISRQIRAGAVHINSMTVHDEAVLPHGGVKNSGWGRFNADAGLAEFLQTKTVTINTAQSN